MIAVYKRKGSPFWYFDVTVNGRRKRISTKRTLKREAEGVADAYRRDELNRVQLGIANRELTIRQALFDHFLPTKAAHPEYRQYEHIARKLVGDVEKVIGLEGSTLFHEMTNAMLVAHRQKRLAQGAASGTVDHEFKVLSQTHHIIEGDYRVNPKIKFPIERRKGIPRFLTPDEEEALLKDLEPGREMTGRGGAKYFLDETAKAFHQRQDNYDLVVMLLDAGARFSEIAKLTWDMVDVVNWKWVHIFRWKVDNEAPLAITDRMRPVLQRRFENKTNRHYVFPGWREQDDGGEAPRGSTRAIRRAMRAPLLSSPFTATSLQRKADT
jgi:integrase